MDLLKLILGNGTNYNPAEALNMYFQTGSIVGRSLTQDGDMNPGKVPIQELNSSSGQAKIQSINPNVSVLFTNDSRCNRT